MKKWALVAIVLLFVAAYVFRRFRKRREALLLREQSRGVTFSVEDLLVGEGEQAVAGKVVHVLYVGKLLDGRVFDASRDRSAPFEFILGAGRVIAGWDKGIVGMKVGGKRRLLIPSHMAYGKRGAGGVIPPDAALDFEVELLAVTR
jgi:FKBP-type peptidyl-prolyl cis-trans isomerase